MSDKPGPARPGPAAPEQINAQLQRLPLSEEMARAAQAVAWVRQGHALPDDIGILIKQRSANWPPRSRAAVRDMAFRAIRRMGLCQTILTRLNRRQPHDAVHALQLVALEQLLEPLRDVHTIVDQAVEAARARRATRGATGLINAVLRSFVRDQQALVATAMQDPVALYNFPRWWIEQLQHDHPGHWQQVLQVSDQPAPLTLRVNQRHTDPDQYLARLRGLGVAARRIGAHAVALDQATDVHLICGFDDGDVSVQDAGAQLAAGLLDVAPGMRVLDACAAPGGKTAHLLESADIDLIALDSNKRRMRRIDENLTRLGLPTANATVQLLVGDAQLPEQWFDGKPFDRVLVDAPCTASGVVRRHPESRWLRRRSDIETLAAQQSQILTGLWPTVKPGGKLLYATCSVFSDEGNGVIDRFVGSQDSARRIALSGAGGESMDQLLPFTSPTLDHDGFYYALIEKKLT